MKTLEESSRKARPESLDFLAFLERELTRRSTENENYSLRAFARDLGTEHSSLSQILRRKRPLSEPTIRRFAETLQVSPETTDRFVQWNVLNKGKAASLETRLGYDPKTSAVLSQRHHAAVLELTRLESFKPDARWIASALGLSIEKVQVTITDLIRLGFLEMAASDRWQDKLGPVSARKTPDGDAGTGQSASAHEYRCTMTVAVNFEEIPLVIEMFNRFRRDLLEITAHETSKDVVYELKFSFEPITQLEMQGERR